MRPFVESPAPFRRNFHFVRILRRYSLGVGSRLVVIIPAGLFLVAGMFPLAFDSLTGQGIQGSPDDPNGPGTLMIATLSVTTLTAICAWAMARAASPMPLGVVLVPLTVALIVMIIALPLYRTSLPVIALLVWAVAFTAAALWVAVAWQWPKVRQLALESAQGTAQGSEN